MESLTITDQTSVEVNQMLRQLIKVHDELRIENPHSIHNLGTALKGKCKVTINGSTGYFTGGFLAGPTLEILGNTGWYTGDNMSDGEIIVHKSTGSNCAPSMMGGTLLVRGNSGSRLGFGMKGGDLIVCGDAGRWAGYMTLGGRIIILGKMGPVIGESMYKGVIHTVDPDVESKIGNNVRVVNITESEKQAVTALFEKYQIDHPVDQFKSVIPLESGRHKYTLFNPTHRQSSDANVNLHHKI